MSLSVDFCLNIFPFIFFVLFRSSHVLLIDWHSLTVCIADGYAVALRFVGLRIIIKMRVCVRVIGTGCHAVNGITLAKYLPRSPHDIVRCTAGLEIFIRDRNCDSGFVIAHTLFKHGNPARDLVLFPTLAVNLYSRSSLRQGIIRTCVAWKSIVIWSAFFLRAAAITSYEYPGSHM